MYLISKKYKRSLFNSVIQSYLLSLYRIHGVIVSVLASSAVGPGFEPRSGHTKDYEIGMCCFSSKYTALRRKRKDWSARNQNKVSSGVSIRGLLFHWASNITIKLSRLFYYKADLITISLKINLFSPWYSWKIAELALNYNHSLTRYM
jgi:hypothetical protein